MTEFKRATMHDVAKKAGVTIGTVSNVINNPEKVAEETIEKVNEAIKSLNYVPNILARNMRSKNNKMIGLLIPNLSNNFCSGITTALSNKAYNEGYTIIVLGFEYSIEKEKKALKSLYEHNVETIIILNGHSDEKYLESYIKKGVKFILVDRRADVEGVSYVEFDNKATMDILVRTLKDKGYQSIGFISEPLDLSNIHDRYDGYRDALVKYGYSFKESYVFISEELCLNNAENGYLHMKRVLEKHRRDELPDVFIVSSDFQAIGVQKAILEKGYRIPEDFGVIGCDDISIDEYVTPRLSSIHQDRELLSDAIWKMVKKKHKGQEIANVMLPQSLTLRDSI
ncbi:DNA-binding LacI/PurR family transcriptional regulator [Aequitasia blattaphilus]|uniref:LacI family transcriptional regulator n=1 Tax=Aequitasia blattaphilus TaxID=2949332 RepID=A0ABT1EBI6_9FIRM|nr:LacI family DNA-binding transcriptional regulator [Aequitasia blattaphilus]MCP1103173.1 LacI family transcriptional regulator [Aequitasia blattaphilus]MCR8615813.1 LacI family transcriptional regulator [Aequitasia blattaphilus]